MSTLTFLMVKESNKLLSAGQFQDLNITDFLLQKALESWSCIQKKSRKER